MTLKRRALLAIVVWGTIGFEHGWSQDAARTDPFVFDGRVWNEMKPTDKLAFVLGYMNGVNFVSMMTTNKPSSEPDPPAMIKLASQFLPSIGSLDIVETMDRFYAKRNNLLIGTAWAIQLIAAEASGTPPGEIERQVALLRQAANSGEAASAFTHVTPSPGRSAIVPAESTPLDEIEKIWNGTHAPVPVARRVPVATPAASGQTSMTVTNSTAYELTVFFHGPVSRKLTIGPGGAQDVDLAAGTFRVAGRASAVNVLPFYGEDTYVRGARYSMEFYVVP